MELTHARTFLLDGDGVLWHGDRAAPGFNRFFDLLSARGIRWGLLTNNATRGAEALAAKFKGFGVEVDEGSIFTSATATAMYLRRNFLAGSPIFVVGEVGLKDTLAAAGYSIDDGLDETVEVPAVVVGLDRNLSYDKIKKAMRLILKGAAFIATNPDTSFPGPDGLAPGAGSVIAAVTTAAGVEPRFMGKPGAPLFEVAMETFHAIPDTTVMVGDRLDTDIQGAHQLSLGSALVLSGVSRREDIDRLGIIPDLVVDDLAALADALERLAV